MGPGSNADFIAACASMALGNKGGKPLKEQITGLAMAIKDEGIQELLENETFRTVTMSLVKQVIKEEAGTLVGSIISAASPRFHGI